MPILAPRRSFSLLNDRCFEFRSSILYFYQEFPVQVFYQKTARHKCCFSIFSFVFSEKRCINVHFLGEMCLQWNLAHKVKLIFEIPDTSAIDEGADGIKLIMLSFWALILWTGLLSVVCCVSVLIFGDSLDSFHLYSVSAITLKYLIMSLFEMGLSNFVNGPFDRKSTNQDGLRSLPISSRFSLPVR